MNYVWYYVLFSVTVGFVAALYIVFTRYSNLEDFSEVKDIYLEKLTAQGKVQKEEYGSRKVFYPRDVLGRAGITSTELFEEAAKKHKLLIALLLFIVGFVEITVFWPKELYVFVRRWIKRVKSSEAT